MLCGVASWQTLLVVFTHSRLCVREMENRFCRFGRFEISCLFDLDATFLAKRALIFTCSLKQLPRTLSSPRGGDMSYQVLNEHFPSFLRFIKWVLFNEVSFSLKQMSSRKGPQSAAFAWAQRVQMIVPFLVWNAKSLERKTNMECDCSGEREDHEVS